MVSLTPPALTHNPERVVDGVCCAFCGYDA